MEETQLRAHLIRIYVVTVAAVLFVVLFATVLLFTRDTTARSRESFSTLLFAVSDQIRTTSAVSHSQLRDLEQRNHMQLSIGDDGYALIYNGADSSRKRNLFFTAEQLARKDGYDIAMLPLTTERRTSPIYSFSQDGVRYLGAVSILPMENAYRTVTMVQRLTPVGVGKLLLSGAGYLAGVLLLSIAGIRLIDRALLPAVESRKRQIQFTAAASHELRSPLAVISANAATLQRASNASGEAAAAIERECARMSRLIGDMLLLASADADGWSMTLAEAEADTVLLNAYEAWGPVFQESGCALTLNLPEEPLPRIMADRERLSQVLNILLDNALSHGMTQAARYAELEARADRKRIIIEVTDHGAGLSIEQKAHIFERFYRGDVSRKDKQHFGLGLSIAAELIRLQNGRLTVTDALGGGCTFRITF